MDLRILLVEDSAADTELMLRHLRDAGLEPQWRRAGSESDLREALVSGEWQVALVDYNLSGFSGPEALHILAELAPDTAAITVTDAFDEETAVSTLRAGVVDYVFKGDLTRLAAAVEHAVEHAELCREQRGAEEALQIAHQRLVNIIEFLPDATFVVDEDKRVVAWNRACETMTGVKKDAVLGRGDYAYAEPFFGERRPILIDLLGLSSPEAGAIYKYVKRTDDTIYAESFIPGLRGGQGAHLFGPRRHRCSTSKGGVAGRSRSLGT